MSKFKYAALQPVIDTAKPDFVILGVTVFGDHRHLSTNNNFDVCLKRKRESLVAHCIYQVTHGCMKLAGMGNIGYRLRDVFPPRIVASAKGYN